MKYNPVEAKNFSPQQANNHSPQRKRRSIRLKGYDYTQPGAYFVTLCTWDRECLFGDMVEGEIDLNEAGRMAEECWLDIPEHFPQVELDEFIIMPNHVHGILVLTDSHLSTDSNDDTSVVWAKNFLPLRGGNRPRGTSKTIGSVVRGFKIGVTKWFRQNTDVYAVWQRNYYEHIIRNEDDLNRIRKYIIENPFKWRDDRYFMG